LAGVRAVDDDPPFPEGTVQFAGRSSSEAEQRYVQVNANGARRINPGRVFD
jgi:hypothetical protein